MIYKNCKVGDPFISGGRRRVNIKIGNKWVQKNYARYLMEIHLERYLEEDEVVHHKDENKLNDSISNLQVLKMPWHTKLHNPIKEQKFICPKCENSFQLKGKKLSNWKSEKKIRPAMAGPFCSIECSNLGRPENPPQKFICPFCKKEFELKTRKLNTWKNNKKRRPNMRGPFCSKDCFYLGR